MYRVIFSLPRKYPLQVFFRRGCSGGRNINCRRRRASVLRRSLRGLILACSNRYRLFRSPNRRRSLVVTQNQSSFPSDDTNGHPSSSSVLIAETFLGSLQPSPFRVMLHTSIFPRPSGREAWKYISCPSDVMCISPISNSLFNRSPALRTLVHFSPLRFAV